RFRLSRRAVLRGAFGTLVGLPLLECMLDERGTALASGGALPCRYFLAHCPTSLVTSGSHSEGFTPTQTGFGYDIRPVAQPLADHQVSGDVSIVSGLFAAPLDVPGGYNVDYHGQAPYAVMTGTRSGFSGVTWRPQGLSADQVALQRLAPATQFPFLYYQLDPQTGGTAVCYEQTTGFEGEPEIVYKQIDAQTSPSLAYLQLFTGFVPPGDEVDPQVELERRLRLSSLSFAGERIAALQARLGAADRATLDEHLTRVRELEMRIQSGSGAVSPACQDPMLGSDDPPDVSTDVPDQEARAQLFVDLIQMAFACDMTRIITLGGASAMTGTGMRHPAWNHVGGLHGEVQHTSDQPELDAANRWFIDVYARIVAALKATPEGDGNVLDNTAALFVMEGGKGLTADPQRSGDGGGDPNHSVDNAVAMLAGRVGGLVPGQHVSLTGQDLHPSTMMTTAFQALGIEPTLGEISGVIDQLFSAS
ncbi:MAG: DUF1552 domain-containing protein, partial [Myxococcales bacterium]|nr:DUF1552 domain-containing protein [Myxococcales bacterium]